MVTGNPRASRMTATVLFLTVVYVPGADAQSDAQSEEIDRGLAMCAEIESSLVRLDCYDQLAALQVSPGSSSATVSVSLVEKSARRISFQDYITMKLAVANLLPRAVRALTGTLTFTDLFDREILAVVVTIEEEVEPGSFIYWDGSIEYNQFLDEHQRLHSKDREDLKIRFELSEVLYTDGTRERFAGQ